MAIKTVLSTHPKVREVTISPVLRSWMLAADAVNRSPDRTEAGITEC